MIRDETMTFFIAFFLEGISCASSLVRARWAFYRLRNCWGPFNSGTFQSSELYQWLKLTVGAFQKQRIADRASVLYICTSWKMFYMNMHTQGFLPGLRGSKLHLVLNGSFFVETDCFLAYVHYPRRIRT